ncbi:hypothetical protein VTL71DRAFT_12098 [Oculimacula yallundae]|uniref:Uncharacterized protein n=1 Tax=Oculimacula yallundae TaxID=86028 RepID=A0ABR4CS27_9HELO
MAGRHRTVFHPQNKDATLSETDTGIAAGQKRKRTQTPAQEESFKSTEESFFDALTKIKDERAAAQHLLQPTSQPIHNAQQTRAPSLRKVAQSTPRLLPSFDGGPKNPTSVGANPELGAEASQPFNHQHAVPLSSTFDGFQHQQDGSIPCPYPAFEGGLQYRPQHSTASNPPFSGYKSLTPVQLPYPQPQQYIAPTIAFVAPVPHVTRAQLPSSTFDTGSVQVHFHLLTSIRDHQHLLTTSSSGQDMFAHQHALPLPFARCVKPEVARAITAAATAAFAAHQISTPKASRTPYPPPIDSEDVQRSLGRGVSVDPDRSIHLSVIFQQPSNYLSRSNIQLSMPVSWDLAFYHSPLIAWFYSNQGGNLPSVTCPIKISFPATGDLLIHWMYKQYLHPFPGFPPRPDILEQVHPYPQLLLADLWICAADLHIPKLQNIAMEELNKTFAANTHPKTLTHVYKHTESGSLLRKYFVWQYANQVSNHVTLMEDAVKIYPTAFVIEWITMLTQMWLGKSGKNDVKIDMTLEDFMVVENKVTWAFVRT